MSTVFNPSKKWEFSDVAEFFPPMSLDSGTIYDHRTLPALAMSAASWLYLWRSSSQHPPKLQAGIQNALMLENEAAMQAYETQWTDALSAIEAAFPDDHLWGRGYASQASWFVRAVRVIQPRPCDFIRTTEELARFLAHNPDYRYGAGIPSSYRPGTFDRKTTKAVTEKIKTSPAIACVEVIAPVKTEQLTLMVS